MQNNKPVLNRSDVRELFDRCRLNLYDLMQIASDKNFNIVIRIDPTGDIDFETYEYTDTKIFEKTQSQSNDSMRYTESVRNRR